MTSYVVNDIPLPVDSFNASDIKERVLERIGLDNGCLDMRIIKRSIDARKKSDIKIIYSVVLDLEDHISTSASKALKRSNAKQYHPTQYAFESVEGSSGKNRPVVIGSGPAGLFSAFLLAEAGMCPIVMERGKPAEKRIQDVRRFWEEGILDPESNVSFGEGGAGTFSDGKLNTLNKDKTGRMRYILKTFVRFGADESILYDAKPHIGTDKLLEILPAMRKHIESLGGEYRFETKAVGFDIKDHAVCGVKTSDNLLTEADDVVVAIGHSARDTYDVLEGFGISMEAKPFAVGFRVEHPQTMIDTSQYGIEAAKILPPASYKLVSHYDDRGIFSFCMCPGGFVVDSSSDTEGIVVNGMSYAARDGKNANSAIVVSVDSTDFGGDKPKDALDFQKRIEAECRKLSNGCIPQQLLGDFINNKRSDSFGDFGSSHKGNACFCNMRGLLSEPIDNAFIAAMSDFGKKINGFDRYDTILSGVESRTSSPIRIIRNEDLCSVSVQGLYPCGEGAGYAGGIMSAASDGLKVAEQIIRKRDSK